MLIAIEGIDGSGKKTQCQLLADRIKAAYGQRLSAQVYDFPHPESVSGPHIKQLLRGQWDINGGTMSSSDWSMLKAIVLQSLQTINRYEAFVLLQNAKHWPDDILILDRYYASAIAYGAADGLTSEFLETIHRPLPRADLTILIDLPAVESMKRRPVREDQYEADVGFLDRVRANYLSLFSDESRPLGKVKIIDGTLDEQSVHNLIFSTFEQHVRWDIIL